VFYLHVRHFFARLLVSRAIVLPASIESICIFVCAPARLLVAHLAAAFIRDTIHYFRFVYPELGGDIHC
jgi:hypothetical protein